MKEFLEKYKYSIIGGAAGLILVILFFTVGFWKTLLGLVIIGVCAIIGLSKDNNVNVKEYFDDFWSNKKEWK
ncbi:MAG: DUF2273 domain-containing protein [Clostridia bacterium]|nr:DUF2273 domain-containing protein [Clostridia bacterium]